MSPRTPSATAPPAGSGAVINSGNQHSIFVIDPGHCSSCRRRPARGREPGARRSRLRRYLRRISTRASACPEASAPSPAASIGNTLGLPVDQLPKDMVSNARDIVIGRVYGEAVAASRRVRKSLQVRGRGSSLAAADDGWFGEVRPADTWRTLDGLSMYWAVPNGGMREPHWHPITLELGFVFEGHGRMMPATPAPIRSTPARCPRRHLLHAAVNPHHIEYLATTRPTSPCSSISRRRTTSASPARCRRSPGAHPRSDLGVKGCANDKLLRGPAALLVGISAMDKCGWARGRDSANLRRGLSYPVDR